MRYKIILAPEAIEDLQTLKATLRSVGRDAIELHVRHTPDKVSKRCIKRLRGLSRPQFQLRVEDVRVFYDITENNVEKLAIVEKSQAAEWLKKIGQEQS